METVRNHVCMNDLGGDSRNYVMLHLQLVSDANAGFSGTLRVSSSGFPLRVGEALLLRCLHRFIGCAVYTWPL